MSWVLDTAGLLGAWYSILMSDTCMDTMPVTDMTNTSIQEQDEQRTPVLTSPCTVLPGEIEELLVPHRRIHVSEE